MALIEKIGDLLSAQRRIKYLRFYYDGVSSTASDDGERRLQSSDLRRHRQYDTITRPVDLERRLRDCCQTALFIANMSTKQYATRSLSSGRIVKPRSSVENPDFMN